MAVLTALPLASVVGAQSVTIDPAVGGVLDEFVLAGEGLQPGLALDIGFLAPEGRIYNLAQSGRVMIVDADGDFELPFVPAEVFSPDSQLGEWLVEVCVSGTTDCIRGTFIIE
jgi:hypothetical protein